MSETVAYYNLYEDLIKYWANLLPDFIYDIKYENLISNTKIEIKNLINYCDLNWSDDCLNFHDNKRSIKSATFEYLGVLFLLYIRITFKLYHLC